MPTIQVLHKLQLIAIMPTIIENGPMLVIGFFFSDLKKGRNYIKITGITIKNDSKNIFKGD